MARFTLKKHPPRQRVTAGDDYSIAECSYVPDVERVVGCRCADFDSDGDVDLKDYRESILTVEWAVRSVCTFSCPSRSHRLTSAGDHQPCHINEQTRGDSARQWSTLSCRQALRLLFRGQEAIRVTRVNLMAHAGTQFPDALVIGVAAAALDKLTRQDNQAQEVS